MDGFIELVETLTMYLREMAGQRLDGGRRGSNSGGATRGVDGTANSIFGGRHGRRGRRSGRIEDGRVDCARKKSK